MSVTNNVLHIPNHVCSERTHLQLPSRSECIESAVEYLKRKAILCGACSETRSANLLLALHEALTNSIVHGNLEVTSELKEHGDDRFIALLAARSVDPHYCDRVVDIVADFDGSRCQWVLTDQGPGFDHEKVLRQLQSDDPEVLLASGRGILLMCSFLDDVKFELGGRRVILTLKHESGAERRAQPRVGRHTSVKVVPLGGDGGAVWEQAYEAVARNVSQGGVGLVQHHLASADRVLIGIEQEEEVVYFPAEVRHWRRLDGDVVELGCFFHTEASDAARTTPFDIPEDVTKAIDHLLASCSTADPMPDRRSASRVPFTRQIEIQLEPGQPRYMGYSRDLSHGGIGFLTTARVSGHVTIFFPSSSPGPPLQVRTEILRCTRLQEGFYDAAGRFVSIVQDAPSVPDETPGTQE